MPKVILLLAIMAHCLTACTLVRYYDVKPMAESFDKTTNATNSILKKVRTDLKHKRRCLHSLKKQGAKMDNPPYAELKALLDPLRKRALESEIKSELLLSLKSKFTQLAKGRIKITSKSPDYEQVDQLRSRAESLMSELEKIVKSYKKDSKKFEAAANRGRVGQIDVIDTRAKLKGFLRKLDANIGLLRSRGSKVQASVLGKKQNIYRQITAKLMLIEQERSAVSILIKRFNKEAGTQKKLWVGPGLLTFSIMTQGEARAANIQKIGNGITSLAKDLKQ